MWSICFSFQSILRNTWGTLKKNPPSVQPSINIQQAPWTGNANMVWGIGLSVIAEVCSPRAHAWLVTGWTISQPVDILDAGVKALLPLGSRPVHRCCSQRGGSVAPRSLLLRWPSAGTATSPIESAAAVRSWGMSEMFINGHCSLQTLSSRASFPPAASLQGFVFLVGAGLVSILKEQIHLREGCVLQYKAVKLFQSIKSFDQIAVCGFLLENSETVCAWSLQGTRWERWKVSWVTQLESHHFTYTLFSVSIVWAFHIVYIHAD